MSLRIDDDKRTHLHLATPPTPLPWTDAAGHIWPVHESLTCVECPHCGFKFAASHTLSGTGGYECRNCAGCPG